MIRMAGVRCLGERHAVATTAGKIATKQYTYVRTTSDSLDGHPDSNCQNEKRDDDAGNSANHLKVASGLGMVGYSQFVAKSWLAIPDTFSERKDNRATCCYYPPRW